MTVRHKDLPPEKPAHSGVEPPTTGPAVWLLARCDGALYGTWLTRHDATGAAVTIKNAKWEWFEPVCVPIGAVPEDDLRRVP